MKVALCLFGVVGSTGEKAGTSGSDPRILDISFQKYADNIIGPNNADVFIHTWDTKFEDKIRQQFSPVDANFQKQVIFDIPAYVKGAGAKDPEKRKQNHYSMWYSIKQSVHLKRCWEETHGFKYDCVMIGRFDTSWETKIDFSSFDMSRFYTGRWCQLFYKGQDIYNAGRGPFFQIESQINMSHVQHRHKFDGDVLNQGLSCLWFFGNSKDMDEFSLLYDHLDVYAKPGQCPTMESTISSHRLSEYHLKQIGVYDNLDRVFHRYCDFPMVRTKYFGSKK